MSRAPLALLVALAACQPTEPPVQPEDLLAPWIETKNIVARSLKPDVILLVDNSAAMGAPVDPSAPACPAGCGLTAAACPKECATWSSELVTGLSQGLELRPTTARLGLAVFPTGESCSATSPNTLVEVPTSDDVDADLVAGVQSINARLTQLTPSGPSSTANALRQMGSAFSQSARQKFVMLVTGSTPNLGCRPSNTAEAVLDLTKIGIKTLVFAPAPAAGARENHDAFNAIANAGGFARTCHRGTDFECGSNSTCDPETKMCSRQYYGFSSAAELRQMVSDLFEVRENGDACRYELAHHPRDTAHLQVTLDSVLIPTDDPTGGWDYADGEVTFKGALCQRISRSTSSNPVRLEFKIFWAQ